MIPCSKTPIVLASLIIACCKNVGLAKTSGCFSASVKIGNTPILWINEAKVRVSSVNGECLFSFRFDLLQSFCEEKILWLRKSVWFSLTFTLVPRKLTVCSLNGLFYRGILGSVCDALLLKFLQFFAFFCWYLDVENWFPFALILRLPSHGSRYYIASDCHLTARPKIPLLTAIGSLSLSKTGSNQLHAKNVKEFHQDLLLNILKWN